MKYIGGISYEGFASGTRVKRFELIDEDTILLDWISKSADPEQPDTRFLGVAQKDSAHKFVTPWVYLQTPNGKDHMDGYARISFVITHHDSTIIKIEGTWEAEGEVSEYRFIAILQAAIPKNSEFAEGVIYACARLIELFDQPTMAKAILQESGVDASLGVEHDLQFIRSIEEFKSLPKGED